MKKNLLIVMILFSFLYSSNVNAFAAKEDAENLAVLMAVMNYKINDSEYAKDLDALRENERFNRQLRRMLDKLSNNRTKNSTNSNKYVILFFSFLSLRQTKLLVQQKSQPKPH